MKAVLPYKREHHFQGFGGSGFKPFRHPFPNLCQTPPRQPKIRKTIKNDPQNGILFRAGRVLESPFGVLGFPWCPQNNFLMPPGTSEATKQRQNEAKTTKNNSNIVQ